MKTITWVALVFFSLSAWCTTKTVLVHVKGMVCAFCAQGITKTLGDEPGVAKVEVSLEKKLVTIHLKEAQELSDKKIEEILLDAGYTVDKVERP